MRNNIDSFTRSTVDRILSDFKASLENCGLAAKLGKLGPPEKKSKVTGSASPSSRKPPSEPRSIQVSDKYDSLIISIVCSPAKERFELFAYKLIRRLRGPCLEVLYGHSWVDFDRVERDLDRKIFSMVEDHLLSPSGRKRTL